MPRVLILLLGLLVCPNPAGAQEIIRTAGRLRIAVETADAYPGGLLVVSLRSPKRIAGVVYGILDGRRCPFFPTAKGLRALVPVPVTYPSGPTTLGVEVRSAQRIRVAVTVPIRPRSYKPRTLDIPETKRAMLQLRSSVRDGRLLLANLRTVTPRQWWRGRFKAPVEAEVLPTFGTPETLPGSEPVEAKTDAIHGEYHRGVDYPVPVGTILYAPAAGTVQLSGPLTLTGDTVVIDHGQGVLSVFYHLNRIDVRPGDPVYAGQRLGLSGDSGIAASPHLHWGVYVHGVAIDPRVMERLDD
jgi:murein DD-endopeptidase MepM/ murein hydrolase activator NlpD